MIPGHSFKAYRGPINEGYQHIAVCKCGHRITTTNYDDLAALVKDHYREQSAARTTARAEASR